MEEKQKIERLRPYKLPDFRSGDVIEFQMNHSLSEGKSNTYTGIVIGRTRRNSLQGAFQVVMRFCGVEVYMNAKQFSPMMANFRLVARGAGNLRSKLNYLRHLRLSKEELSRPIIKRTMKKRKEDVSKTFRGENVNRRVKMDTSDDKLL